MDDSKTVEEIQKEMRYQKLEVDRIRREKQDIENNKIVAFDIMRELVRELITAVNLITPRGIDDTDQGRRVRALYTHLESLKLTEYDHNGSGPRRESIFPPTSFQSHSKTVFRRSRAI